VKGALRNTAEPKTVNEPRAVPAPPTEVEVVKLTELESLTKQGVMLINPKPVVPVAKEPRA
jgi:hypothetical protein